MVNWNDIWIKKGNINLKDDLSLLDLIKADGFDLGGGVMTETKWLDMIEKVKKKTQLLSGNKILEVGCGSGAFLYPLYLEKKYNIFGVDYSTTLLELAKKVMPNASFFNTEASSLPFGDKYFDIIISNSVFNYFSDYNYAESVLKEILRVLKDGGRCQLLDLNDISKKEFAEKIRKKELGEEKYNELYKDLKQLYYDKNWFINFFEKNNIEFEISDQDIDGYKNSEWRFNVFFRGRSK